MFRWDHNRLQINTNLLRGILKGSPMVVTLGQQYNIGEKPAVMQGHEKKTKQKHWIIGT